MVRSSVVLETEVGDSRSETELGRNPGQRAPWSPAVCGGRPADCSSLERLCGVRFHMRLQGKSEKSLIPEP